METRIQKTLRQWFPEAFADEQETGPCSDYEILQQFARYTIKLIRNKKNEKEPFEIVSQLYQKTESPGTLKWHLELMPDSLKTVYLKTILEN